MTVQIENIGGKTAVVLSPELLKKLNAREGDTIDVTDTPRGVELASRSSAPNVDEQLAVLRRVARKNREALSRLAQ